VIDLTRSLVDYLRGDPILATKLGAFRGYPSVFGVSPIPEPATTPFIVTQSVADTTLDKKSGVMREIEQDIGIYDDEDGSVADIESIAEYVREKMRGSFSVPDWTISTVHVSGPTISDVEDLHGRTLSARIILDR